MRAIFLLLIIAVVALILAFATGFLHLNQTRPAQVPSVAVSNGGVVTSGGQSPSFEVETGSVAVGTQRRDVTLPRIAVPLPSVRVNRADRNAQPQDRAAAPANATGAAGAQ